MNKTRITINPDWLEFILAGQLKQGKLDGEYIEYYGGFVLKDLGYGTKHFSRHFEVYHDGVILGSLRTTPRNDKILDPLWQQFKIENSRLYETGYIDLCIRFFNAIGSTVRNVSRLDIAADGFGFMRLMQRFEDGMIEKIGKADYTLYKNTHREIQGFDLGSKKSDKSICGYRKSKEIEKSGKKYIEQFWEKSGLPNWDGGNVERLEIRLKNNALKRIEDFDWTRLEDPHYLAGVMKLSMFNFFDFRQTTYSNQSRAKRIEFINWESVKAERLESATAKQGSEYLRLKQTAKTLYWLYLTTKSTYHLQIAQEVVTNINCISWFLDKKDHWKREYEKKMKGKAFEYLGLWENEQKYGQLKLTEKVTLGQVYETQKAK